MGNYVINTFEDIFVENKNYAKYQSQRDSLNLIKYIFGNSSVPDKQKNVRYKGGFGVPCNNPIYCCDAMYIIKKYYNKETIAGCHIFHFIISFPEHIRDANTVKMAAIAICHYIYQEGFQCMYGVHEDTENLHIHIAVNRTNFITGNQFRMSPYELKTLTTELKKITFSILRENGY